MMMGWIESLLAARFLQYFGGTVKRADALESKGRVLLILLSQVSAFAFLRKGADSPSQFFIVLHEGIKKTFIMFLLRPSLEQLFISSKASISIF